MIPKDHESIKKGEGDSIFVSNYSGAPYSLVNFAPSVCKIVESTTLLTPKSQILKNNTDGEKLKNKNFSGGISNIRIFSGLRSL